MLTPINDCDEKTLEKIFGPEEPPRRRFDWGFWTWILIAYAVVIVGLAIKYG